MASGKVYKNAFWRRLKLFEVRVTLSPFLWGLSSEVYSDLGFAYFKLGPVRVDVAW